MRAWIGTFATNVANLAIGVATGVLAARLLGPEARGHLAEAVLWGGLVASLAICGVPAALTRSIAADGADRAMPANALVLALLLAGAAVAAFAAVHRGLGAMGLGSGDPGFDAVVMLYVAAYVPLNFLALTMNAVDHGRQRFRRLNLLRLLPQSIYLAGLLLAWLSGLVSIEALLIAMCAGTAAVVLVRGPMFFREVRFSVERETLKALFASGAAFHATTLVAIIFGQIDRIVIATTFPASDLGLYAVAMTLAGAGLGTISAATTTILLPKISSAGPGERGGRQLRFALTATVAVAVLLNGVLALAAPLLTPLLFGDAFRDASLLVVALCAAQVPLAFLDVAALGLRALGDWRAGPKGQAIGLVCFVCAVPVLVTQIGVIGVPLALLVARCVAMAWMARRVARVTNSAVHEFLLPSPDFVVALRSMVRTAR